MRIEFGTYENARYLQELRAASRKAKSYYSRRDPLQTFKSIGASGSMFRVFRGITKPSVVYQKWAFETIHSTEFERKVLSLQTQEEFEKLHSRWALSLATYWARETEQDLKVVPYGYKILDVFVKRACQLKLPHSQTNHKLLLYGHVPMDSLVFNALDDLFSGIFPLKGLTMGQLKTESAYRFYQDLIRELMAELGSPALYFDYYAWNLGKDRVSVDHHDGYKPTLRSVSGR